MLGGQEGIEHSCEGLFKKGVMTDACGIARGYSDAI